MADIRINLIGASGSGTSTVGRSLASALRLPHFEADDYYHAPSDPPFQKLRPAEERRNLIQRDLLTHRSWILSGGVVGWSLCSVLKFTCIVFLYVPTAARIDRLRKRERERFGSRLESGGDMHVAHEEFIDWASRYDLGNIEGKTLALHEAYLATQKCQVLELRGELEVPDITTQVLQFLRMQ